MLSKLLYFSYVQKKFESFKLQVEGKEIYIQQIHESNIRSFCNYLHEYCVILYTAKHNILLDSRGGVLYLYFKSMSDGPLRVHTI